MTTLKREIGLSGWTFGQLLRALRKARNLGLADLSSATGIDPSLLSRYENDARQPPDLAVIRRIADALDISEDSQEFKNLMFAANPELAILIATSEIRPGTRPALPVEPPPVFCETLADLVSQVTSYIIRTNPTSVMVTGESGIQTFRMLAHRDREHHARPKRKKD